MKAPTFFAAIGLLVLSIVPSHALAAHRMAYPPAAIVAVFPIVFIAIESNLCTFVAWSVAPDWPPERQRLALGSCPPRAAYK